MKESHLSPAEEKSGEAGLPVKPKKDTSAYKRAAAARIKKTYGYSKKIVDFTKCCLLNGITDPSRITRLMKLNGILSTGTDIHQSTRSITNLVQKIQNENKTNS